MPVYTYRCDNCGVRFEREQRFTDPPLTRCPECSQKTLRKVYLPVGIVFKGSGFYATDHRSPSGQVKKQPAEKDSEKSGDKTGEIKKEPASASKDKKD